MPPRLPAAWFRESCGAAGQRERNGLIDILRLLGAVGIAWFHTGAPGHALAYAALPMFIALSVLLQPRRADFAAFLRDRLRRLLRPWVIWSALYALVLVLRNGHHGLPLADGFHWGMLVVGTILPLWFLPFIFVCGLVLWGIESGLAGRVSGLGALGLGLLGLLIPLVAQIQPQIFPVQWIFGLVPVAYGFAARLSAGAPQRILPVALVLSLSALVAGQIPGGGPDAFALWFGIGLALITQAIRLPFRPWMAALGPISFLVYLVHPGMFLLAYGLVGGSDPFWLALLVIGLSLSFALTAVRLGWDRVLL